MSRRTRVTITAAILFVSLFAGSVVVRRKADDMKVNEGGSEEALYLPSGKALKKLSLGYSGLLATVYWTRTVQYFGARVRRSTHFELLAPLLEITTDLDPHLLVAYETGSIFLSQQVPDGAGEPDKAVALLQKGIQANPNAWRLYFDLGFVHYMDRQDYESAEDAFKNGSKIPGAHPWMKVMAARMAEHTDNLDTALALWEALYQSNNDKDLKANAISHIQSLQARGAIDQLEERVQLYRKKKGVLPSRWSDLIKEKLLSGVPLDPTGKAFQLMPDGTVEVENAGQFPFLSQQRRERH